MDENVADNKIIIGCPSHISTFYLADFIDRLKSDYPNIRINIITEKSDQELLKMLDEHKIDFVIDSSILNIDTFKFEVMKIKEVSSIFVANKEIEIKNESDFENYKYIFPSEDIFTKQRLMNDLEEKNIHITSNLETDVNELRLNMIKSGLGIGYVYEDTVKEELDNKELYKVEIPFDLPKLDLNLIYSKSA